MSRLSRVGLGVAAVLLLLAYAIPQYLNAVQRSMFKRGWADMRAIGKALERYRAAHGSYPVFAVRSEVGQLEPYLVPAYITFLPRADNWNRPLLIISSSTHYELWSLGKDGWVGPNTTDGPTHTWDDDSVFSDGRFVRYPSYISP